METPTKVKYEIQPKKRSPKMQRTIKISSNDQWMKIINLIREYRSSNIAPVDTMGCTRLADSKDPATFRYHTLVALQLSSQTKDPIVADAMNILKSSPTGLSVDSIIAMDSDILNKYISKVGFHNRKTEYLKKTAIILKEKYNSDIPRELNDIMDLPGVGPKMAYLTLQCAWDSNDGIGVDTHVHRISNRMGFVATSKPEDTRMDLEDWLPREYWKEYNHMLVGFGQLKCFAVNPQCKSCPVQEYCHKIGVKKWKTRKVKKRLLKLQETAHPVETPKVTNIPAISHKQSQSPIPKPSPKVQSSNTPSALEIFTQISPNKWEHKTLEFILHSTIHMENSKYYYMRELHQEFISESISEFSFENFDRIIYSRLTISENLSNHLFDYLLSCWIRCQDAIAKILILSKDPSSKDFMNFQDIYEKRISLINSLKSIIINYSGLVIHPDMQESFPISDKFKGMGPGYLAQKILPPHLPEEIPVLFLTEFIARFKEDGLDDMLRYITKSLDTFMRDQNITTKFKAGLNALAFLISFKDLASMLPAQSDWCPSHANARSIEVLSILGPFFSRTSIFPDCDPIVTATYFPNSNSFGEYKTHEGTHIGARNPGDVKSSFSALRDIFSIVKKNLSEITLAFVKSGAAGKEGVLFYFSHVLKLNLDRGKMQMDVRNVSTHGFMHNIMHVCLSLCDPILDPKYSKLNLINDNYFYLSDRIDISEDTRINADKKVVEDYTNSLKISSNGSGPLNFVSEIFFLTIGYHHFGLFSTIRHFQNIGKQLGKMVDQLNKLRNDQLQGSWEGPMQNIYMAHFKNFQNQVDTMIAEKLSIEASLLDRSSLEHSLRFYNLVIVWLIRCATSGTVSLNNLKKIDWGFLANGNSQEISLLNLSAQCPLVFAVIPEWIFEDVCELYLFILRSKPIILEKASLDEIVTFAVTFLGNPLYIKNPYLKSKLVEILYHLTHPLYQDSNGRKYGHLSDVFITHPIAREVLVGCLTNFYIDVEQTGMHSQFYDKFNIRFHISQIFKSIWNDQGHRKLFIAESKKSNQFIKFAALIMNDTTYLLDESLSKLKEIQTIQNEIEIPLNNPTQAEQEARNQRLETLEQYERQAYSCMSLGTETVHMLQYLTVSEEMIDPFMAAEVVDRLAAMLDYNLQALCGPRCSELKVKNPEKYAFNPKKLLNDIIEIFLHLGHRSEFVLAVARDGRSYSKDLFARAGSILFKNSLKSQDELNLLHKFISQVESKIRSEISQEEELGDVPDEYLDPLLYTIMEEPVILPSSKMTVDLSTIKSHLLSDKFDPFNRQPLTIEEVIPNKVKKTLNGLKHSVNVSCAPTFKLEKSRYLKRQLSPDGSFGIEAKITNGFINQINPILIDVAQQLVPQLDVTLPSQQINVFGMGNITVSFDPVHCEELKIYNRPSFPAGLFFANESMGFRMEFDIQCKSGFKTTPNFLPSGVVNIKLRGASTEARLAFDYDSKTRLVTPVLKKMLLAFKEVSVTMGDNKLANLISGSVKMFLPVVVAEVSKRVIKAILPGLLKTLLGIHFKIPDGNGNQMDFHSEFISKPIVNDQGLFVNIAVVGGADPGVAPVRDDSFTPAYPRTEKGINKLLDKWDDDWFGNDTPDLDDKPQHRKYTHSVAKNALKDH